MWEVEVSCGVVSTQPLLIQTVGATTDRVVLLVTPRHPKDGRASRNAREPR